MAGFPTPSECLSGDSSLSARERRKSFTSAQRVIFARARNWTCACCHAKNLYDLGFQVDHIQEIADGGSNESDNLQLLCPTCHAKKTMLNQVRRSVQRRSESRSASPTPSVRLAEKVRAEVARHEEALRAELQKHAENLKKILGGAYAEVEVTSARTPTAADEPLRKRPRDAAPQPALADRSKDILGAFWATHRKDTEELRNPPLKEDIGNALVAVQALGCFVPALSLKEFENALIKDGILTLRGKIAGVLRKEVGAREKETHQHNAVCAGEGRTFTVWFGEMYVKTTKGNSNFIDWEQHQEHGACTLCSIVDHYNQTEVKKGSPFLTSDEVKSLLNAIGYTVKRNSKISEKINNEKLRHKTINNAVAARRKDTFPSPTLAT